MGAHVFPSLILPTPVRPRGASAAYGIRRCGRALCTPAPGLFLAATADARATWTAAAPSESDSGDGDTPAGTAAAVGGEGPPNSLTLLAAVSGDDAEEMSLRPLGGLPHRSGQVAAVAAVATAAAATPGEPLNLVTASVNPVVSEVILWRGPALPAALRLPPPPSSPDAASAGGIGGIGDVDGSGNGGSGSSGTVPVYAGLSPAECVLTPLARAPAPAGAPLVGVAAHPFRQALVAAAAGAAGVWAASPGGGALERLATFPGLAAGRDGGGRGGGISAVAWVADPSAGGGGRGGGELLLVADAGGVAAYDLRTPGGTAPALRYGGPATGGPGVAPQPPITAAAAGAGVVVAGGADGGVAVYDARLGGGALAALPAAHAHWVSAVAVAAAGEGTAATTCAPAVLSGGTDGVVRLWRLGGGSGDEGDAAAAVISAGGTLATYPVHDDSVYGVAWGGKTGGGAPGWGEGGVFASLSHDGRVVAHAAAAEGGG
ncbi:hypothetical protein MMPV_004021 [Pyropia vietnamensis]